MGILGIFRKLFGGSSEKNKSERRLFDEKVGEFYENIKKKHDRIGSSIRKAEEKEENATIKKKAYENKYKKEDDEDLKNRYASKIAKLEEKLDQYAQQISLYEKLESNFSETLIDLQILRDVKPPFSEEIAASVDIFNEKLENEDQLTDELLNMIQDMHGEIDDWLDRLDSSQQRVEQLRKQHQLDRQKEIDQIKHRLDEEEQGAREKEKEKESVEEKGIEDEEKKEESGQEEEEVVD